MEISHHFQVGRGRRVSNQHAAFHRYPQGQVHAAPLPPHSTPAIKPLHLLIGYLSRWFALTAAAVVDRMAASVHALATDEAGAHVDCRMSACRDCTYTSGLYSRMMPPPRMPRKVLFFGSVWLSFCKMSVPLGRCLGARTSSPPSRLARACCWGPLPQCWTGTASPRRFGQAWRRCSDRNGVSESADGFGDECLVRGW